MTIPSSNILHTGGDPRALAEFSALRQEIARMHHPSASGVDWQRVELLSVALFRLNGMDLQSVSWYTLARAYRAGLPGLCEGLEIVTAMLKHQWPTLWPHPLSARLAIITWLSASIQEVMHALPGESGDLPLLLHLQSQLEQNVDTLERLAQKHLSQLDRLVIQVNAIIGRWQSSEKEEPALRPETAMATEIHAATRHSEEFTPLIYVPRDLTSSSALNISFTFWEQSRRFFAGMATMALLGGLVLWACQLMQPVPGKAQRMAMLAQQITPGQARTDDEWQQSIASTALPTDQLLLWHTAQLRLQKLTESVNALNGKACLPTAELEAQLVTVQQPLKALLPVEELLRQLEKNSASPVLRGKIEHRLKQQISRYALILQADQQEQDDDW